MKKILIINASVRKERSQSRQLSAHFEKVWRKKHPEDVFNYREVGLENIPHVDVDWISSAFVEPGKRNTENQQGVQLSNILIEELKENNIYIISTPMYNWSIPSGLKAYIDQIMRINETWKFKSGQPDGDYEGLLENKSLYILSTRGDTGYGKGQKNEHMNFQTTYLKFLFEHIGVEVRNIVSLDNEEFGGKIFQKSKEEALKRIEEII